MMICLNICFLFSGVDGQVREHDLVDVNQSDSKKNKIN